MIYLWDIILKIILQNWILLFKAVYSEYEDYIFNICHTYNNLIFITENEIMKENETLEERF